MVYARRCLNPKCYGLVLRVSAGTWVTEGKPRQPKERFRMEWNLLPESLGKRVPDYVPKPLHQDYIEADLICDKSPRASATLARRCLQGMIRDFCGITKSRLIDEVRELEKRVEAGAAPRDVDPEHIKAIHALRTLGNIGAHMEKDIDLIVDVDEGEARKLIDLIEMLFHEWYGERKRREERIAAVVKIAEEKEAARLKKP